MTAEIKNLYPTPVMFGRLNTEVVHQAAEELLTLVDFSSGGDLSNVNLLDDSRLYQFKVFFQNQVLPMFKDYAEKIYNCDLEPNKYKFKAWSANGAGYYNLGFHNHSGATLSAVFYLLVETTHTHGGQFKFHDPRFNANRGLRDPFDKPHLDYEVSPQSGDFLIFPSYLYHSVSTFYGSLRLIVPVDMYRIN